MGLVSLLTNYPIFSITCLVFGGVSLIDWFVQIGYDKAKAEVRARAKPFNEANPLSYARQNLDDLKAGKPVNPRYIADSRKLYCLPEWSFSLLGDKYVVRMGANPAHKYAWILTDTENTILNNKLRDIILFSGEVTEIQLDDERRAIKAKLYECLEDKHSE
jgi:hypothetical protein